MNNNPGDKHLIGLAGRRLVEWCKVNGAIVESPSSYLSEVADRGTERFVVLRNCNRVLAVYPVREDGSLGRKIKNPKFVELI
jgi:hypothetical protein